MPPSHTESPALYLTNLAQDHEPIMALSEMVGGYHSMLSAEKLAYRSLLPAIARTGFIETPKEVMARGNILTNPSKTAWTHFGKNRVQLAYFRDEPMDDHLGKTMSRPYVVEPDGKGFRLTEADYKDAEEKPGEDPRHKPNVALKGLLGKIHRGVGLSTLVATPKSGAQFGADIEQVFWWGEDYGRMEPVAVIKDNKNADFEAADEDGTTLHLIGRPHPHVTYKLFKGDLTKLDNDTLFDDATVITQKLSIPRVHFGGNGIELIRGGHDPLIGLDLHTGYALLRSDGTKDLYYWQSDWIIQPSAKTMARCVGTFATRGHFGHAEPKPPNGARYDHVIYGARGQQGRKSGGLSLFGISDSRIGYAVMA